MGRAGWLCHLLDGGVEGFELLVDVVFFVGVKVGVSHQGGDVLGAGACGGHACGEGAAAAVGREAHVGEAEGFHGRLEAVFIEIVFVHGGAVGAAEQGGAAFGCLRGDDVLHVGMDRDRAVASCFGLFAAGKIGDRGGGVVGFEYFVAVRSQLQKLADAEIEITQGVDIVAVGDNADVLADGFELGVGEARRRGFLRGGEVEQLPVVFVDDIVLHRKLTEL